MCPGHLGRAETLRARAAARASALLLLCAALVVPTAGLTGVLTATATAPAQAATSGTKVRRAKRVAMRQRGDRYRYGAEGPHRFDCSGLVWFSLRRAGYDRIPRSSGAQADHARRIKKRNLRRGDLMFFHDGGDVYHVGIFIGRRDGRPRMVHAPSTGKRVHVASPWTRSWYAATLRRR
jgi:cell wall-associated NlpC family hydrolase